MSPSIRISSAAVTTATMISSVDDARLQKSIFALVQKVDLETTGLKKFVKLLARELNVTSEQLLSKKDFIKMELTKAIEQLQEEEEEEEEEDGDSSSESEVDDEEAPNGRSKTTSSSSTAAAKKAKKGTKSGDEPKKKKGGGGGGLSEKKEISDALAAFLGKGKQMARTDIVKQLWEYIRLHELQNPENKREILLDENMKHVFGCSTFTMFTMNKYIGAHIYPYTTVDLSSPSALSSSKKKSKKALDSSRKKRKNRGSSGSPKKERKTGTQPPYHLSQELQAVVGASVLPRPQVVSKLWEYIKLNNLQNPSDKREILCDFQLQRVMKKPKVTMFNMNQLITPHLLEKADKSEYTATIITQDDGDAGNDYDSDSE